MVWPCPSSYWQESHQGHLPIADPAEAPESCAYCVGFNTTGSLTPSQHAPSAMLASHYACFSSPHLLDSFGPWSSLFSSPPGKFLLPPWMILTHTFVTQDFLSWLWFCLLSSRRQLRCLSIRQLYLDILQISGTRHVPNWTALLPHQTCSSTSISNQIKAGEIA